MRSWTNEFPEPPHAPAFRGWAGIPWNTCLGLCKKIADRLSLARTSLPAFLLLSLPSTSIPPPVLPSSVASPCPFPDRPRRPPSSAPPLPSLASSSSHLPLQCWRMRAHTFGHARDEIRPPSPFESKNECTPMSPWDPDIPNAVGRTCAAFQLDSGNGRDVGDGQAGQIYARATMSTTLSTTRRTRQWCATRWKHEIPGPSATPQCHELPAPKQIVPRRSDAPFEHIIQCHKEFT